ncbi:sensor histidine kinase [Allokutzneria albata]|uniref:histidine kinase n=1 Tax=Allokutzneria albata TaxID=211114 RepID=A0A1G9T1I4_ALLAB|nr:sensor histidine kinase [Allokutzneria albata]SDM41551.1 Signal transduction histidine kinase [Allokutzneria albata]
MTHPRLREWKYLAGTMFVGLAAMVSMVLLLACVVLVVTLPLLPKVAGLARGLAAFERRRTGEFLGTAIPAPPRPGGDPFVELLSVSTRRDVVWLVMQAFLGSLAGAVAVGSPAGVVQNIVFASVWPYFPGITSSIDMPIRSWGDAGLTLATAAAYGLMGLLFVPPLARWYARVSAARLAPPSQTLVERLAEVTATRAAALEAHGTELRRIERGLHDGTQNRLVAVVMHLGMAERALRRNPEAALPLLLTAQNAATDALTELREVVRSIYPPVLADRGLEGAVTSLAAHCAIPCTLGIGELPRVPAAVEAAAYFVIAEALTNAVKHSGAKEITVGLWAQDRTLVVEVTDDGMGGADEGQGSGLLGIRRRVDAFDGITEISSPSGGPTVVRVAIPTGA